MVTNALYVCNVLLDVPLRAIYSYLNSVPLSIGTRVTVMFRNKLHIGFIESCIPSNEFSTHPIDKLSQIISISPASYALPEQFINIAKFASNYYHHPLNSTIFTGIPTLLKKVSEPIVITSTDNDYYQINETQFKTRSPQLLDLYNNLKDIVFNAEIMRNYYEKNPQPIIKKWLASNIIVRCTPPNPACEYQPLTLNDEQNSVVTEISQRLDSFNVSLLYGITGSGKTEVFLHLIRNLLLNNKQILVLVPEINLTPQLAKRFKQRFPYAQIKILNSEVSENQRLEAWLSATSGQCQIILGTRLAVFTPFKNLGLIIVDEEHDDSFKQNDGLRYHARDLAVWRAKTTNIPILLASATPSLETLYNYKLGKYQLYKLTKRANPSALLPTVELINLQHYPTNYAGISEIALTALKGCLARQEMALVFINRRGYAPIITCYDCGWVSECRHCSSKMVYHHTKHQLRCHHCGYQTSVPKSCPKCQNQYLHTIGHGTQKLEEFLHQQFPQATTLRVDRDTTKSKKAWEELYQKIAENKIDILVGTQMLAKGHDFPNLTLVIGLNLDNALFSHDFRASEDMFNMLTQVTGRAGRAEKTGQVLLQTNYPAHAVYQFIQQHDFNGFINYILQERHQNNLPPFCHHVLIRLSSLKETALKQALHDLQQLSRSLPHHDVKLFAAIPALMYKLHNRYRGQMLISSNNRILLHRYLSQLEAQLNRLRGVTLAIDVDPLEV